MLCVANHHYEISDIMIRSEKFPCQKKRKMLVERHTSVNKLPRNKWSVDQIIAIHSLTLSGPGGGAQRPGWPNSQLPIRNLLSYDAQTW